MFGSDLDSAQLLQALYETLYMVSIAFIFRSSDWYSIRCLIGNYSKTRHMAQYSDTSSFKSLINILRSLPFIILLIAIVPFTKLVVGTSIGTTAAIVPLTVYVAPYIARLVENSLLEVDEGLLKRRKRWALHHYKSLDIFNP